MYTNASLYRVMLKAIQDFCLYYNDFGVPGPQKQSVGKPEPIRTKFGRLVQIKGRQR